MMRIEEEIFDWEDWDEVDVGVMQYYDVTFKQDFGPFKQGEQHSGVALSLTKCQLTAYDEDGNVLQQCSIKLVPA